MMNLTRRVLMLTVLLMTFYACQKSTEDSLLNVSETVNTSPAGLRTGIQMPVLEVNDDGVLVFDDFNEIEQYMNAMEAQVEDNYQAFLSHYPELGEEDAPELSDAETDQIIGSGHYQPDAPYENFESQFAGFTSLRVSIHDQMEDVLSQEDFDWSESPDAHFIQDEAIRTFLNQDAAVKIGDKTYFILSIGWIEAEPEAEYAQILSAIDDINTTGDTQLVGPWSIRRVAQRIFTGGGGGPTNLCQSKPCRVNRRTESKITTPNKKVISSMAITYYPWGTGITGKAIGYKKFIRWIKYPGSVRAHIYHGAEVVQPGNCGSPQSLQGKARNFWGWQTSTTITLWGSLLKTKCDKIKGANKARGINVPVSLRW